ncbi:HAD family hydrolase [Paenibacillus koleovorans]|uniref:HAD family hydrolase n=1 Tax=Paenibacillus koleovorans TaxID=121608 RepID=UPI000FDC5AED|nr:HAD family hydrolase [Paenibacillus koleovorans]
MKKTTILFDFDGTVADTLPVCFHALREVFREFDGLNLSNEEIVARFGPTEPDIIRLHLTDKERAEQGVERFLRLYDEHHPALVPPSQPVLDMVHALKRQSLRLGIVTGKGAESLRISLRHLQLDGLFDVEISGDDVRQPKPHPEGVLLAMERLGSTPEETMFLGDSIADVCAGKAAGVLTAAVRWFEHVQTQHFEVEPDLLFTAPEQVTRYIVKDGK